MKLNPNIIDESKEFHVPSVDSNQNNITTIINPSETSDNENYIFDSYGKESTIPYTSSSDDLRILKLDKQSSSDIINFSNFSDEEDNSLQSESIYKDNTKENTTKKNSSVHKKPLDDNFEIITDISSIKIDSDNTEKYFKELAFLFRQNLKKSMDNCKNLCNDLKLRDVTIKSLKSEMEELKKNYDEKNKKLSRSEKEISTLKQREAKFLENIKELSDKELEQKKNASSLKTKYNMLEKQYNNQQTELSKVHECSQRHLNELKHKEEELKVALEEVDKCRDEIKIEEEKQFEMKKRLKEYESQLKTIPIENKDELKNNDLKWQSILKEQEDLFKEKFEELQDEIIKKNKEEEELVKRNNELLIQIENLSNQINDMKAERELELSLSQSLNGSNGMLKNLNVELNNALTIDQEKDKKIEENMEEIKNLSEKCQILEKEIEAIKNEKQLLIEKEKEWNTEKEENIMLITEFLEPNLKKYMDNEVILKNTIEELNKEILDLKENMNIEVQKLVQKSKEEMINEQNENNKANNIKSIVCMVNDAVQTTGDMKEMITQIEKGLDDFDKINNELINEQLESPLEFHINKNRIDYNDQDVSLDQSELIIADVNNLDSEVPVISCNISIIDDDLAKLNEKTNNINEMGEEVLNNKNIDNLMVDTLSELNNFVSQNQNVNETLLVLKGNQISNLNENENDNNIIINNNVDINEVKQINDEEQNLISDKYITNDLIEDDSSKPNIPIIDRHDTKNENGKDEKIIDSTSIHLASPYIKSNKISPYKRRKYDSKTILSFIFLQSFIIFSTAVSVILTIEKMLGIRIIMKFVDTFLENEHYIKEESSPS